MQNKICVFFGNRPAKFIFGFNEEHPDCIKLKNAIKTQVCFLVAEGHTHFISGMSRGVDMWAAEAVLEIQKNFPSISLEAALPCITQASRWTEEQRNRYIVLLSKCNKLTYVNYHYFDTCKHERNKYMLDKADTVIAVLNEPLDSKANKASSSYATFYAAKKGKRLILINPETAEIKTPVFV